MIPKRLILAIALLTFGSGLAAGKVIQPDDKSGDDIRAAATQFLNDLADGKEKEVRAEFVGTGESATMLDRMLMDVSLGDQLHDALKSKFPNDPATEQTYSPGEAIHQYADSVSHEPIDVGDDGKHASVTPGPEFEHGIDLTLIDGKWKASFPLSPEDKDEQIVAGAMDATNAELPRLIDRVKKGDFANINEVIPSLEDAVKARIRVMATTRPALKEVLQEHKQTTQP